MGALLRRNRRTALVITATSLLAMWLAGAEGASAATLAQYDFATNTIPSVTQPNTTVSAFQADTGFGTDAGRSSLQNFFVRSSVTASTQANALNGNDYVFFTVTVDGGYQLDLTQLQLKCGSTENVTGSYTTNTLARFSDDNFATFSDLAPTPVQFVNGTDNTFLFTTIAVDLTGASFQNLTGTIGFRFYIWDDRNDLGAVTRFDDVVLSGAVEIIPEPASLGLLTIASGLITPFRGRGAGAGASLHRLKCGCCR